MHLLVHLHSTDLDKFQKHNWTQNVESHDLGTHLPKYSFFFKFLTKSPFTLSLWGIVCRWMRKIMERKQRKGGGEKMAVK